MAKKSTSKAKKAAKTSKGAGAKTATKKAAKKTAAKTAKKAVKTAKKASKATKSVKKAKKTVKKTAKKAKAAVVKKTTKVFKMPKCPLGKKELKEFREMLLEKRRTLLGDMTGMAEEAMRSSTAMSDHSTMPVHMADIGTDNYEQEFTLGLLESERQLLREIDEALERIANSTYGLCVGTGEPISTARLNAKPWARYSIKYVRLIEQGTVRMPANDFGESAFYDDDDDDE